MLLVHPSARGMLGAMNHHCGDRQRMRLGNVASGERAVRGAIIGAGARR
jgi:hypothetical protein